MRSSLRWQILAFTVFPLVTLAIAALWMVNRSVSNQGHTSIQDNLRRSSAVFENMLAARARELTIEGQVIAQDPKFFSVLTLPGAHRDPQLRATVSGVARDFATITGSDVFEVLDGQGRLVSSIGRESLTDEARTTFIAPALAGRPVTDVIATGDAHYQVSVTPVVAGGRVVGALVIGMRIGTDLAERLRSFTRSEVTFLAHDAITVSTLERDDVRDALLATVMRRPGGANGAGAGMFEVRVPDDVFLTLYRPLPRTTAASRQYYVMQRSLREETMFLRAIQSGLLQLGVVAVIVAILAGVLIAERILSPVRKLVRGAEEMERGNYDFPIDDTARDEIGYLAHRFVDMRQHQRAYVSSLEEVARLKSEFINVASHELRTPISIIKGFQELMAQGSLGPINVQQADAMRAIARSTDTLSRIAENATRVAQIEGSRLMLELDEHEVAEVLRRAMSSAEHAARGRQVQLSLEVAPEVGTIRADGARLSTAVSHLVSNGIRFTPDGGSVAVRATRQADAIEIAVKDTGVGIPEAQRSMLFERTLLLRDSLHHHSSSTLEFNSAGLGLGLSIARGIAEAHGGSLSAESEVGRGSTFTLRVPDGSGAREKAA